MAILKTTMIQEALGGALLMVVLGCGGSQQRAAEQSAAAAESVPDAPVGEAPQCVDDKEQPVTCLSDGDCCSGFVCGKDPELSARTSYCIYGG
jgi:hypothetical protein